MIKIEHAETSGWLPAIRGMRNPMNSWEKSDSGLVEVQYDEEYYMNCMNKVDSTIGSLPNEVYSRPIGENDNHYIYLGENDLSLMKALRKGGADDRKFLRMITVYCDITAPLYWWKEFDTYKVGTVANSCSTMHKIHAKEFTINDFSHEHLIDFTPGQNLNGRSLEDNDILDFGDTGYGYTSLGILGLIIKALNFNRKKYLETKDKEYWWQMIQLLPTSYNQKRTVMMNYEVLINMYHARKNHKLDEWHDFCNLIESLPYAKELIKGEG